MQYQTLMYAQMAEHGEERMDPYHSLSNRTITNLLTRIPLRYTQDW